MLKDLFKNYIYPISTLSGSIIGVGFLSLPYTALKVGIWPMLFYFILLTGLMTSIHVIFGQICLKTADYKRFPGFVGFHLGKFAKVITLISMISGSFGVLLIYLIVGGQFLTTMASPFFGGSMLFYVFLYFCIGSLLIYFGIKTVSKIEFLVLVLLLISFFIIFIESFTQIKSGNIFSYNMSSFADWKTIFLPYGSILFSLWGIGLIPETEEMLKGNKKLLKKVIIVSTLIPAVIYLLFIFLVLGISGGQTTEVAITGLQHFLSQKMFSIALFIGLISTFTAFITGGILLKETFIYDMQIKKFPAWVFACFIPFILFLLGFNSFIFLVSFVGGVLLSIDGILILMMYRKIGGKKIIIYPLMLVFILGIIYEIVYFIR